MKYFTDKKEVVSLREELDKCSCVEYKRVKRLYDALGDTYISKEFYLGYLEYFDYRKSRREDLPLTKEALLDLYEISEKYPLSSLGIKMIMGEYTKDVFDDYKPFRCFDKMSIEQMDIAFEEFFKVLKDVSDKRDEEYLEEAKEADSLSYMYGDRFAKYIKELMVKYHKTFDEVYYLIPYASVIRKDADKFYDIARREMFGASGYPYSFLMCKHMILFGDIDCYKDRDLIYSSSIKGSFASPITADEFLSSVEQKRKDMIIRKK